MEQNTERKYIDLREVVHKLRSNIKTFYKVWIVVFVVTAFYVLCLPRGYRTSLQLAPEIGGDLKGGNLMNLASTLGFGSDAIASGDAISPLLYPDLMSDNGFVASLYNIRVQDVDNEIDTTYYAYMRDFQKYPFWTYAMVWIKSLIPSSDESSDREYDPYYVSLQESKIMEAMRSDIDISVDKETAVITITTSAQDPLIARTLADSVKSRLQEYIIDYRTGKARVDLDYYHKLRDQAWREYDSLSCEYARCSDSERDIVLRRLSIQLEKMERDMHVKFNTYTTMESQYQAALAKVQERTPAFAMIKGADVPVLPSYPRRTLTVLVMLVLSTIVTTAWILRKEVIEVIMA